MLFRNSGCSAKSAHREHTRAASSYGCQRRGRRADRKRHDGGVYQSVSQEEKATNMLELTPTVDESTKAMLLPGETVSHMLVSERVADKVSVWSPSGFNGASSGGSRPGVCYFTKRRVIFVPRKPLQAGIDVELRDISRTTIVEAPSGAWYLVMNYGEDRVLMIGSTSPGPLEVVVNFIDSTRDVRRGRRLPSYYDSFHDPLSDDRPPAYHEVDGY